MEQKFCQSCGMPHTDEMLGTNADGSKNIAYKMCLFYPELMDELRRILTAMDMEYYSPALRSVRNRILANKYYDTKR